MHWWRSDDWQDVIADVSDPAVARLALTASAGHSIGFEALAQAAEDPAVVYAYNRAGADEQYAPDVVAALDVYDRTTTALMAAGMPESIAASRAALVFGIPMVDNQYLEVAKQPVMPSDILVASADEALARAFSHLVPDEVVKADEPWDESEVNRDPLGRFAPETGTQQAYRVVGGRKVAISTQVKTSEQTQKQTQEIKASRTDEQMLEDLARQNEEQRQFAAAKRAKRLQRLNRLRGVSAQQKQQRAQREAKAAEEQKATKVVTAEQKEQRRLKVVSRRGLLRGMTKEQVAELREEQRKEKIRADAKKFIEQRNEDRAVRTLKYGPIIDLYDAEQYNPWADANYDDAKLRIAGYGVQGKYIDPTGTSIITRGGEELDLLVERGGHIVDGQVVMSALFEIRSNITRQAAAEGADLEDPEEEFYVKIVDTMNAVVESLFAPTGRPQITHEALVWVEPGKFARLSDLTDAFMMSTDVAQGQRYADPKFPIMRYDEATQSWGNDSTTISVPGVNTTRGQQSVVFGKADEPWDESEVNRDAIGRFAPEGHREVNVGGRRMLVKVEQPKAKVESKKEIERTSTDTQDLAWVAQRNRQAAMRRRRLARLKTLQVQQQTQRPVTRSVTRTEQKAEAKQVKKLKVVNRQQLLRGLTKEQKLERQRIQMRQAVEELKAEGAAAPTAATEPEIAYLSTSGRIGQVLDGLREAYESGQANADNNEYILRISPGADDFHQQTVGIAVDKATRNTKVTMDIAEVAPVEDAPIDTHVGKLLMETESAHLLVAMTTDPHGPLEFRVHGSGVEGDEFHLEHMPLPDDIPDTTARTQIRTVQWS